MIYSSRDERKIGLYSLTQTNEDKKDEDNLNKKSIENQDLANLKKFFEQSPLDDLAEDEKEETKKGQNGSAAESTARDNLFKSREHY